MLGIHRSLGKNGALSEKNERVPEAKCHEIMCTAGWRSLPLDNFELKGIVSNNSC